MASHRRVAILGHGVEGQSAHAFFAREGWEVVVYESEPFPDHLSADLIIRSPGIRPDVLPYATTTVTTIFFERCPCPVIGVTGTKGKGTTSSLIYEMLKKDGRDAYLGGNIGVAPLDFLSSLSSLSVVVLELSSFQLMDCSYSPHIGVSLMIVPEHQDWHHSIDEYVRAKGHIFAHQDKNDIAVINVDYPLSRSLRSIVRGNYFSVSMHPHKENGVYVDDGAFVYQVGSEKEELCQTTDIALPGKHNWENVMAAIAVAKAYGVHIDAIRHVLQTFAGLPYRLEKVGVIRGVTYYNDSFSTTPETAIAAIRAFDQPKILILGGSSKNADFSELGKVIAEMPSIRAIIGIGQEWKRIKSEIQYSMSNIRIIEGCSSMVEVIAAADSVAQPGDVVVLSPACASFDMFKNYKDRGDQFREAVRHLQHVYDQR